MELNLGIDLAWVIKYGIWAIAVYLFIVVCWFFYIAVMALKRHRSNLGVIARFFGATGLAIGLVLDLLLAWVVGPILFLSIPREFTLTAALKRHQRNGGWRGTLAAWVCQKMLNQFDPDGHHC